MNDNAYRAAVTHYRLIFGWDEAIKAGVVETVLEMLTDPGFAPPPHLTAELCDLILGHDDMDDDLAGILAATQAAGQ